MIPMLEKRLERFKKELTKIENDYNSNRYSYESYMENRLNIDRKICGLFELQRKRIKEDEFTERQIDIILSSPEELKGA